MVFTQAKGRVKEAIETQNYRQQQKTLDLSGIVVSVDALKLTPGNSMRPLTHPQYVNMQDMDDGMTNLDYLILAAEQVQAEQKIK